MTQPATTYDEVPYVGLTFPQTRPDQLATLAAFNGMTPADPGSCRVLELGCGDGTNLASFAYILPNSDFVGIDLARGHIEQARKTANDLGLKNLSFECADVMDLSRDKLGEFDYVIAHGLFSWVPEFVRTKILEIYRECLTPQGVGYISYNVMPGCHVRQMVWNMMRFHTSAITEPLSKVQNGIGFLDLLSDLIPQKTVYRTLIEGELAKLKKRSPDNIYHDDLASLNQPFYFHEFVDLLNQAELQFVSEIEPFWLESNHGLTSEQVATFKRLADDVTRREQYIDFLSFRSFRASLICHPEVRLDRDQKGGILRNFYLSSQVIPKETDSRTAEVQEFQSPDGEVFEAKNPLTTASLLYLQRIWTRCTSFEELISEASSASGGVTESQVEETSLELLDLYKRGHVYLHRYRPEFPVEVSERPMTSRFVHWQLSRSQPSLTTLSGMNLSAEDGLMRLILVLCDGTRDVSALVSEVSNRIDPAMPNRKEAIKQLPDVVRRNLEACGRLGLLEG